ncbi:hypothetical protein E2C01_029635 [Portunus trituberculatus]|uniref:Uncharacterized protein n=1 Tax=Portunus trituberculatus TaxID=210409 RepID=A0A5B7ESG1_PORTR|nr:hypothetical protein [Portunus trituberculatus]
MQAAAGKSIDSPPPCMHGNGLCMTSAFRNSHPFLKGSCMHDKVTPSRSQCPAITSPQVKLVPRLTSGRWTRGGSKGSTTTSSSQAGAVPQLPPTAGPLRAGSLSRGSLNRTPQRNSNNRLARQHHTLHARTAAHDHEDEVRQPLTLLPKSSHTSCLTVASASVSPRAGWREAVPHCVSEPLCFA